MSRENQHTTVYTCDVCGRRSHASATNREDITGWGELKACETNGKSLHPSIPGLLDLCPSCIGHIRDLLLELKEEYKK